MRRPACVSAWLAGLNGGWPSCHPAAVRSGARIVHSCGFDSVPSDIGVLLAHHAASASSRRIVTDPYALSPDRTAEPTLGDERELSRARYDPGLGQWTGPFVMASFNTRVVRRSNALQGWAYGRGFRYREVAGVRTPARRTKRDERPDW